MKYSIGQLIEDFKEVRNTHGNLPVCVYNEDARDQFSFVSAVIDLGGTQGKVLMIMTAKEADKYIGKGKAQMPPKKSG